MYCRFCGNQIPDDSIYCPQCGKLLSCKSQAELVAPVQETFSPSLEEFNKANGAAHTCLSAADEQPTYSGSWNIQGSDIMLVREKPQAQPEKPDAAPISQNNTAAVAAAPAHKLGMKWYKFLIYFGLLCGAFFNLMVGIAYITGVVYGDTTSAIIYSLYGAAFRILDISYGIFLIVMAGFVLVVHSKLYGFRPNAPTYLYAYYITCMVSGAIYMIAASKISGIDLTGSIIGYVVPWFAMLFVNIKYFSKRAHLFPAKPKRPKRKNSVQNCFLIVIAAMLALTLAVAVPMYATGVMGFPGNTGRTAPVIGDTEVTAMQTDPPVPSVKTETDYTKKVVKTYSDPYSGVPDKVRIKPKKSNAKPTPPPEVRPLPGSILSGSRITDGSELTVIAPSDSDCVVKLKTSSGQTKLMFYVRSGSTVTVNVPMLPLYAYFAYGETWYGINHLFGPDTYYSKDDDLLDFSKYTFTYTLHPVSDGNFSDTPIDPSEF